MNPSSMDEYSGDGGKAKGSKEGEQYREVQNSGSISQAKDGTVGKAESISRSKDAKIGKADSTSQSKDAKIGKADSIDQLKDGKVPKPEKSKKARHPPTSKKKPTKPKTSVAKLRGRFTNFGITVKKLWDVWGRFKTKNTPDPNLSTSEKTLGVPGFEEIACIEAEVPDIMMMDKDRVRTSCKECMKDMPTFPTKEQIKAKLMAADKYYGVKSPKTKRERSDTTLEHEADYYDVDGRVVRPSWRFILERPLVEQYVLMTNYIRKVSVLSELKEENPSKGIEEEDSGSDTEYKKFEQKFIKEKQELLKPFKKPETQDMAVQTSFGPEQDIMENLKESVSEISLYPESEDSTNSPEASAVTIVTSRDYSSPLQSDFDGRTTDKSTSYKDGTTDKSTSYKDGKWWESQATCQPCESFQTSYDSINKNTSSGTDGQSIPVHSTWGKTSLQHTGGFSNESDSRILPHTRSIEPATHRKPKEKKVSFSSVVTCYEGPNKNAAEYRLPGDQDISTEAEKGEPLQQDVERNTPENQITAELQENQVRVTPTENQMILSPPENQIIAHPPGNQVNEENTLHKDELPNRLATGITKQSNRKMNLGNILQDLKKDQIISVSLPADSNESRILHNKQTTNVVISRLPGVNQPPRKIYFQEFDEIPDVQFSDPKVSTVQDATIQTNIPTAQKNEHTDKFKAIKQGESPKPKGQGQCRNSGDSEILPAGNNPQNGQMPDIRNRVTLHKLEMKIPNKHRESPPPKQQIDYREYPSPKQPTDYRESLPPKQTTDYETSRNPAQTRIQFSADNPPTAKKPDVASPVTPYKLEIKIPNIGSNYLGSLANEGKESIGTETNIQSAPVRTMRARTRSASPKKAEEKPDDHRMIPMKSKIRSDTASEQVTLPEQTPVNHISRIPLYHPDMGGKTHSQQQQSTDTEGSSTSNEHLKLKASPACFFKVATPTDLSRISVDEFYPDVPEIDAELSQISEIKPSSSPPVEIVFANKETALKYTQDAEFPKITRKEESTVLQRSMTVTGLNFNASNKGSTIQPSPRVAMKVDEGSIDTSKNEGKHKYSNPVASKAAIKNTSQQSSTTNSFEKNSDIAKLSQYEAEPTNIPQKTGIERKRDSRTSELKHRILRSVKVNETVKLEEVQPTETLMARDPNHTLILPIPNFLVHENNIPPNQQQKISATETTESKSNLSAPHEKSIHLAESYKENEEPQSYKNEVNEKTETGKVQGKVEQLGGRENPEQLANSDETLIARQCQMESLPMDPGNQSIPHGWTKLYMRTLSSLAEESSSVAETTSSSTQEKLIDMPVMERSVEELKTIFEKKPSTSAESEIQAEESHCDPKKCTGLSKEQREADRAAGHLVSAELTAPVDNTKKIPIANQSWHPSEEKSCSKSGGTPNPQSKQNQPPAAVKLDSKARDMKRSRSGTAADGKPERSDSSSHVGNDNPKNSPVPIQEDSSVQLLSQIDVIRESEIYSNTSMYFSTSEDRVAKLNKARTVFQPMTLDDDLEGSACSNDSASPNDNTNGLNTTDPGPSKNLASNEKMPEMPGSITPGNKDSNPQALCLKFNTNHEGDNFSVGHDNHRVADTGQKLGKGKGETEEPPTTGPLQGLITKTKSKTDDTSNPSETKQWLMDVIPVLSKHTRCYGFRQHKPVCVKEVTEGEAVKFRQEAVKPVFRFLKKQREMEENKE